MEQEFAQGNASPSMIAEEAMQRAEEMMDSIHKELGLILEPAGLVAITSPLSQEVFAKTFERRMRQIARQEEFIEELAHSFEKARQGGYDIVPLVGKLLELEALQKLIISELGVRFREVARSQELINAQNQTKLLEAEVMFGQRVASIRKSFDTMLENRVTAKIADQQIEKKIAQIEEPYHVRIEKLEGLRGEIKAEMERQADLLRIGSAANSKAMALVESRIENLKNRIAAQMKEQEAGWAKAKEDISGKKAITHEPLTKKIEAIEGEIVRLKTQVYAELNALRADLGRRYEGQMQFYQKELASRDAERRVLEGQIRDLTAGLGKNS